MGEERKMEEMVYEKLREHLDRLPIGTPKSGKGLEIEILKRLFSPEEAELATKLSAMPESLESIATRLGKDRDELSQALETMANKGIIFSLQEQGVRFYNLVPFLPGIYEFQVNRIDADLARLFDEYYMTALGKEVFGSKSPWMRVIPVEREIPAEVQIFPYEKVSEIIKAADSICLANCICRKERKLVGEGCDAPTDNCLIFSHWGRYYIERGLGREISKEEALKVLDQAEEAGLVHCSMNAQTGHFAICNCCGCCCAVLRGITHLKNPKAIAKSNYILSIDPEACVGCGVCIDRCHVEALSQDDAVVKLDSERCIGCGVCILTCPSEALSLQRKEEITIPFKNVEETLATIAQEKGRL
jgi:ferredoxin/biotin operon repressor